MPQILFFTEISDATTTTTVYMSWAQLPNLLSLFFAIQCFLWLINFDQSTNLTDPYDVYVHVHGPTLHVRSTTMFAPKVRCYCLLLLLSSFLAFFFFFSFFFFILNYLFRWKDKYMFVFFRNTNWSWSMGSKGYQSGINHLFIIYTVTQYLSWNFCWISRHLLQDSWAVNGIFLEKVKVHNFIYIPIGFIGWSSYECVACG